MDRYWEIEMTRAPVATEARDVGVPLAHAGDRCGFPHDEATQAWNLHTALYES